MSNLKMPKIDNRVIQNRDQIIKDLGKFISKKNILSHQDEIKPYETDGLTAYKQKPLIVILPGTTEEVSKILLNFPRLSKTQSAEGNAPPDKPVPAPLGTTLMLFLLQ